MPYDPDPRPYVIKRLHQSCSYIYYEQPRRITDLEAETLHTVLLAYSDHKRITRNTHERAERIINRVFSLT